MTSAQKPKRARQQAGATRPYDPENAPILTEIRNAVLILFGAYLLVQAVAGNDDHALAGNEVWCRSFCAGAFAAGLDIAMLATSVQFRLPFYIPSGFASNLDENL